MSGKMIGKNVRQGDGLLTPQLVDDNVRRRIMVFMEAMEAAVLEANCSVFSKELPNLNQDAFLRVAVRVSELRADYIRQGLKVAEQRRPSAEVIAELTRLRSAYEEMAAVFEAAERVIERGYVTLK